jgi:hypothetical protein
MREPTAAQALYQRAASVANSTPSTGGIGIERNQNYEFKISQDR